MALVTFIYRGQEVFCPKYDHVFKAVFLGKERRPLASFLSSVLNIEIDVGGLVSDSPELSGRRWMGKRVRLDVVVTLPDGSVVNIEMQVGDEHNIAKRSVFTSALLMGDQLERRGEYGSIPPVVAINILDFVYLPDSGRYITRFRLRDVESGSEMPDAGVLEIIFIELPKLPAAAGGGSLELWLKFLSAKTGEELDMLAKQSPELSMAVDRLVEVSASKKLRNKMRLAAKADRDFYSSMAKSRREGVEEGMERGMEKGMEKGMAEAKAEDARKMRIEGCDNAFIAKITGLSIEQIERL